MAAEKGSSRRRRRRRAARRAAAAAAAGRSSRRGPHTRTRIPTGGRPRPTGRRPGRERSRACALTSWVAAGWFPPRGPVKLVDWRPGSRPPLRPGVAAVSPSSPARLWSRHAAASRRAAAPAPGQRRPMLTLRAAVVAERLGHPPDAALTLGRAVAVGERPGTQSDACTHARAREFPLQPGVNTSSAAGERRCAPASSSPGRSTRFPRRRARSNALKSGRFDTLRPRADASPDGSRQAATLQRPAVINASCKPRHCR
jgi:hypothetical protein